MDRPPVGGLRFAPSRDPEHRTDRLTESSGSAEPATGSWGEIFTGRYGIFTFVLNLGMMLFAINYFVVATVLPSVVADLGGVGYYTWAFSLFAVGAIVGAASAGQLRAAFGARRAYAGAGLALGIGLAGSALATDMPTLVAWRLVQGIGGGAIASQAYGLVATIFPERLRGRVLTIISTVWGVATVAGPAYGAVFAEAELWRGAFWSLVPLTVVFAALAWRFVADEPGHGRLSEIPYRRLALLALAVVLLSATSLTRAVWLQGVLVIAAFAFAAIAFVRDARAERNMFPRQTMAIATELGATYWIFLLVSIVLSFINTYTTFYLQMLHGMAPLTAGYLFAVQSFMWTAGALAVATLKPSHETAAIVTGLVLVLVAAIGIAFTVVAGPVVLIAIAIGVSGIGIGLLNNPAIQRIMAVAPPAETHIAGTSVQAIRNIGIAFGAAASGMVAASAGLVDGADRATVGFAMEWVYGVNVVFAALALALALRLLAGRRRHT
jgi:MFS family permease